MDLLNRFFKFVNKTDSCWLWTGSTKIRGYGQFYVPKELATRHGRNAFAHRVSWELHHGPIPDGLIVCHTCDTPACVNPEHLFLGTDKTNAIDKMLKGRAAVKIDLDTATAIKNAKGTASQRQIARQFRVSQRLVWNIHHNLVWPHA